MVVFEVLYEWFSEPMLLRLCECAWRSAEGGVESRYIPPKKNVKVLTTTFQ